MYSDNAAKDHHTNLPNLRVSNHSWLLIASCYIAAHRNDNQSRPKPPIRLNLSKFKKYKIVAHDRNRSQDVPLKAEQSANSARVVIKSLFVTI